MDDYHRHGGLNMAGSSRADMETYWGAELSGIAQSQWGEDVNVTLDDKLHMSETALQTCAGPINWTSTSSFTFAGPVDINNTLDVLNTATFQSHIYLGGNFYNTATFNTGISVGGIATFSTTVYFVNPASWFMNSAGLLQAAEFRWKPLTYTGQTINSTTSKFYDLHARNIKDWLYQGGTARISFSEGSIYLWGGDASDKRVIIYCQETSGGSAEYPSMYVGPEHGSVGGDSFSAWYQMYAKYMYDDDGTLGSYDEHDDLRIIRDMRPWMKDGVIQRNEDGIPFVDYNTIPDFLKGKGYERKIKRIKKPHPRLPGQMLKEERIEQTDKVIRRKYIRGSNLAMFGLHAIKQLDIREEEHFNQLVEITKTVNEKMDMTTQQIDEVSKRKDNYEEYATTLGGIQNYLRRLETQLAQLDRKVNAIGG